MMGSRFLSAVRFFTANAARKTENEPNAPSEISGTTSVRATPWVVFLAKRQFGHGPVRDRPHLYFISLSFGRFGIVQLKVM
jgi:hypothetical protein